MVDEEGNVVSAKATSGNSVLRRAAENAAWQAKFEPVLLSGQKVKMRGVLIYHFYQ
jgi:protein TonB